MWHHTQSYIIADRFQGPDTDPVKAKRFEKEAVYMKNKWELFIDNDPSYNSNLSLMEGYTIDVNRGNSWPWLGTKRAKEA